MNISFKHVHDQQRSN